MGKSRNEHAETLGVQCKRTLIAKIEKRAKAIGISKSRYAALILEKWEADGEKPVSQADRALYVLNGAFPENETVPPPQPRFGKTESQPASRPREKTTTRKKQPQ